MHTIRYGMKYEAKLFGAGIGAHAYRSDAESNFMETDRYKSMIINYR